MVVADSSTVVTLERDARARLSQSEADKLEWLFSTAPALFERSTSGGIFEAMRAAYRPGGPKMLPVLDGLGGVIGEEEATTARPTAEVRIARGFEPSLHDREKYGRLSRRVNAVLEQVHGEHHIKALRRYFGSEGNRWAQLAVEGGPYEMVTKKLEGKDQRIAVKKKTNPYAGHRSHGRIGAVYMLTRPAVVILEAAAARARKKGQPELLELTDEERLQLELCTEATTPERSALVSVMNREARARFALACIAWNATAHLEEKLKPESEE